MSKWQRNLVALFLAGSVLATACAGPSDPGNTASETIAVPVVTEDVEGRVLAEAVVEPARSVTLLAAVGGELAEVPVAEGEKVAAGGLLLTFDSDDAELTVARAETAVAESQAQLAMAKAGTRQEQIAVAKAQLTVTDATVAQAAAQRDAAIAGLSEVDALDARAQLLEAGLVHAQADSAHDDTMKCYNVMVPDGSERNICPTLGTFEEMARYQMEAAYAGLVAAQVQLDMMEGRSAPAADAARAAVSTAVANRDAAQAQLDLALAGARSEEVQVAEAGVTLALTALAQAQEFLDQTRVEAPFDGTVTDLPVEVGDAVAQGSALATLATLDQLQLRTTDLTELDVVGISAGQDVLVRFDASPTESLHGTVVRVEPQGRLQFGDVIYDVVIALDSVPEWIRWGMTAQVEIDTGAGIGTRDASSAPFVDTSAPPQADPRVVQAEAAVVPWRSSEPQFTASGEVAEVLVEVGMEVQAGDMLARLGSDRQELAVAASEAALSMAQSELLLAMSGAREADVVAREAALAAAKAGLQQAMALRDQLDAGVAEAEYAGVQAQLEGAEANRRQLEAALHWAEDDDDDERVSDVRDKLRANEARIAAYTQRLDVLPTVAAARLREANAGVAAAQGQVDVAQAALDLLLAGPTEESVAIAKTAVLRAEVDLAVAELALTRTQLRSPIGGTVVQVLIESGDTVGPGRPTFVVADLARLRLETTDLTELDVVHIHEGQHVEISIDALPEERWMGNVVKIKPQYQRLGGDVVYPVLIELDQYGGNVRWGMSAAVSFVND